MEVPGTPAAPGASVPPELIVMTGGSTVPTPVSMPVEFTVTLDVFDNMPSTSRMPPLTVVLPE
jgi:hypothetical protein